MDKQKVIIIGAGITGLVAGIYLQKAGFETEIYEMHTLPGGMCTAWKKQGYTFDGCIHWLMGSSPDGHFHNLWRELGGFSDTTKAFEYDVFSQIELSNGQPFFVYTSPEKLKKQLLTLSTKDDKEINRLIDFIDFFSKMDMSAMDSEKKPSMLKQIAYFLANRSRFLFMNYLMKNDIKDYVRRFRSPLLREAISKIISDDICAVAPMMMLAFMAKKACGWVMGGSFEFAKGIEQKYISLGGKVVFKSRVKKIEIADHKATGIILENGEIHSADFVVSCADGYDTIYRMLGGQYLTPQVENAYQNWKLFPSTCQISLGVKDTYANLSPMMQYMFPQSIQIDPKTSTNIITVRVFNFDPSMAPAGCVAMTIMVPADYEYWSDLRKTNKDDYDWQKARVAHDVIDALNSKLEGIKGKVEVFDVATPVTYERYNNIWKGSWEGFWPNAKQMNHLLPSTLPGLENFWMAGQWLVPGGGLPTALNEGIRVCKEISKAFPIAP